jgi:hypothetical protein
VQFLGLVVGLPSEMESGTVEVGREILRELQSYFWRVPVKERQSVSYLSMGSAALMIIFGASDGARADAYFVYSGQGLSHSSNSKLSLSVGERLPVAALKSRFRGYEIKVAAGEDCAICGSVNGAAGKFAVYWNESGTVIVGINSIDKKATDAMGNRVGTSLRRIVGDIAHCIGDETNSCKSPRIPNLNYVYYDSDDCKISLPNNNNGDSKIPACVKVEGFAIRYEGNVSN